MSDSTRHYRSLEERAGRFAAAEDEFAETPLASGVSIDRRGLLKGFAAVFAATGLTGCTRGVVTKAVPLLVAAEDLVPGRATWSATTCGGCSAGCGMLVKCRDGRPIKAEGIPGHPISQGGLCAIGQAQVLSLYDPERLRGPRMGEKTVAWTDVDAAVLRELEAAGKRGAVRVLSATVASATVDAAIARLLARHPDGKHVVADALSASAIADAHERTHGRRLLPRFRFDRARVIVSFDADFLGTWLSPVEHTAGYRAGRSLAGAAPRYSYLCQLEARLSLTGGNADRRVRLAPGDMGVAVAHLTARLAKAVGTEVDLGPLGESPVEAPLLAELADRLLAAKGEALVVSGSHDPDVQALVNLANHLVQSYGATLDVDAPSRQRLGSDRDAEALVAEMEAGKVAALLLHDVNPVQELVQGKRFAAALAKVPLTISFATHLDETSRLCRFVCPVPHFLESWGEAEPVAGTLVTTQPAIAPLWQTRPFVESLGRWSGDARPEREQVVATCAERHLSRQKDHADVVAFHDATLHDGFAALPTPPAAALRVDPSKARPVKRRPAPAEGRLALVVYPKVAIGSGKHGLNPWLQELPDPISKAVWDNYACLSPATADRLRVSNGSLVSVSGKDATLELPVLVQVGQHDGVVAIALGYGRDGTERFATIGPRWLDARPTTGPNGRVGVSVQPLLGEADVAVKSLGKSVDLALTQDHHTLAVPKGLASRGHESRPHVQTTTLRVLATGHGGAGEHGGGGAKGDGAHSGPEPTLWADDFASKGPRWALAIDLNACTGCGACAVGCQAENNIPVVGRDEVRRHREMTWLRVDRYYAGDGDDVAVAHQPMMCHHCNNAPCETVCPVAATVHSTEGLNQQVYNRCVGTRYCANNCPFKTRRFNWFDYPHAGEVERLVLNPDVVVRSRGVMEKCSLCHQRIQEAKLEAKRQGTPLRDGDIQPACAQSCPAKAIVFGDANDPGTEVAARFRDRRFYTVLPELNLRPGVGYLGRVRNADEGGSHRAG